MLKLKWKFVINGESLLKLRLCVYLAILGILMNAAIFLLSKDFSKAKDPNMRAYVTLKWKLITTWFNVITIPYLAFAIYYSWMELSHKVLKQSITIDKLRNFFFNSVLLPVTMFADITFWCVYYSDRSILMPLSADEFVSVWDHHIMHTISLLFVIFELICVQRERPKDMTPQFATLTTFITLYLSICLYTAWNGEYVYPGIKTLSVTKRLLLIVYFYISNYFFYAAQWLVVDRIWGNRGIKGKTHAIELSQCREKILK